MDSAKGSGPQIVVVAGTGRSGTSLFTGLSGRLGFHVPKPEVVANKSNPRGFSEPRWLVDFHNDLLEKVAVAVEDARPEAWDLTEAVRDDAEIRRTLRAWIDEQLAVSDRVVVKDPRLAWFIELHRAVVADSGATLRSVTMLRDLPEVMKSREIAYGTKSSTTTRVAGWLNTMLGIEHRTRELPRAFVRYDELLADWSVAFDRAERSLDLPILRVADDQQRADADDLVDPSLRRSVTNWSDMGLPNRLEDLAARSYAALGELVAPEAVNDESRLRALDDLREEFHDYYEECADISRGRVRAARIEERRKARRQARKAAESQAAQQSGLIDRVRHKLRGANG